MGKKTRTRRTKWRRLSLGEASGPEEEDDEIQYPEELSIAGTIAHQSSSQVVVHSDELSVDEQFAVSQEDCPVVVTSSTTTTSSVADVTVNCNTSGQEQEETEMMVSNHHQQTNQPQPQQQRNGPAWKLAANQQAVKPGGAAGPGYYNVNNGYPSNNGGRPAGSNNSSTNASTNNSNNGFRRGGNNGPRYNNGGSYNGGGYGNGSYGRANSWNSSAASSYNGDHHHHHHHHHQPAGLSKMHGIEKKIFNDEEYTKISTPRQEVLFKKGSIGAKKRVATTPTASTGTAANDSGSEQDSVNGNAVSPVSPPVGDADSFQYGNVDSGSTGDASSTAGEAHSPDAASSAIAAATSGAALQTGYDGTPLVCFPMYDFYGGYGGMYPGSMLVQTYPGGPIVAAVPVPVPVQTIDWYRGAGGAGGAAANGTNTTGEVSYYYALGYPAGSELSAQPETSSSSRRNSLESYQASSQEATTGSEGSSSENSSPCSTGPSSQGPASPQGELVSPAIDPKAQTGGGVATAAAAAAVVMDMTMDNNRKMAVAGYVYPYAAYGLAPPALFASGSVCDPNSYFYDDNGDVVYYEQYEEEAMDVNADTPDELLAGQVDGHQMLADWKVTAENEEEMVIGPDPSAVGPVPDQDGVAAKAIQVNPNPPAGTGRRKKRRKKRNKTRSPANERASQPRVTDDGAAQDEEDEEEETVAVEQGATPAEEIPAASSISLTAAVDSSNDPLLDEVVHPHHSSLEPSTPLSSPSPTPPSSGPEPESVTTELSNCNAPSVAQSELIKPVVPECCGAISTPTPALTVLDPASATAPADLLRQVKLEHCLSLAESSVLADPLETLEPPAFCSTPAFATESFSIPAATPAVANVLTDSNQLSLIPSEEKDVGSPLESSLKSIDPAVPADSIESSTRLVVAQTDAPVQQPVEEPKASHPIVQDCQHELPEDLPAASNDSEEPSVSSSATDSIEEDSLTGRRPFAVLDRQDTEEDIDRDSLDGEDEPVSSSDDFVYLQLDERDHTPDGYFEDEPGGMVGDDPPRLPQLWRTVILEESEPNSKEMSPLLCSDSGIVAGTPSPPVSSADFPAEIGPITKAVSQWLESAPIQQQLIASSAELAEAEADESDEDDFDDYQADEEVGHQKVSVPKNGPATLRIAPSSDESVTDGPLRRVDSVEATGQDLPSYEEEPPIQPLTEHCDPAKYSVYYQLGVSVDQEECDGRTKEQQQQQQGGEVDDSLLPLLEDSGQPVLIKSAMDETIEQCPLTEPAQAETAEEAKKRRKRNAWRRVLLLHRAVHKSRSGLTNAPADNKTKRLKSGPSCCALQ